ncbi:hypothetical protein N431DRAFT_414431 [Stipitochalara longipes BDJ]|nr:hypothetical protein N431DRAFT_414431 [Stipitochalara longipes BDJ]
MDDYEREFRVTSTDIRLSFLNEIDDIFGHSGSGEESKSSACLSAPSSPFILSSPSLNSVTEVPLRVTLEELLNGIRKKIKVKRRDNLEEEFLEVDVKPGMKQGTKIKFENFGNTEGGQRNLHFVIEEKQHPIFSRKGNDLQMKLQLDLVESLCGFSRVLQPLDKQTIWIEKTRPTQPGSSGRLPNLGMPLLGVPGQRGALIIKYVVKYPTTLSPSSMIKLRDALKQEMPQ